MRRVIISGSFDDLKSRHMRLLQEAARLGSVDVLLWTDEAIQRIDGKEPTFPLAEREYFIDAIRYVDRVIACDVSGGRDTLPSEYVADGTIWVVQQEEDNAAKQAFCEEQNLLLRVIREEELAGYPDPIGDIPETSSGNKKVMVTGCYDWFHSGHVRFFEEVSELGDLYVVVGNDANVKLLKGDGHPMYCEDQRRYMAGSIRFVTRALVSTGTGWLDAEPEIERYRPDRYAVNEDGDRPEKSRYCESKGIEYCVLKRTPKEGLPRRESTHLRGF